MTTITIKKANDIIQEITNNGQILSDEKITRTTRIVKAIANGWEYSLFYYKEHLSKIEEYNGRELNEAYVEERR